MARAVLPIANLRSLRASLALALALSAPPGSLGHPAGAAAPTTPGSPAVHSVLEPQGTVNVAALAGDPNARARHSPAAAPIHRTIHRRPLAASATPTAPQAATATTAAQTPSPPTSAGFAALGDNDTVIPPDTDGAVGPKHVMTALNSQIGFQDRAGNPIRNGSGAVIGPISLDSFWSSLIPTPKGVFDPRVRYDPFAGRWMFAAASDGDSRSSTVLVAVSQTSDPTGTWSRYRLTADPTSKDWADYPNLGFNTTWVTVTVNMFSVGAGTFDQARIFALDRADLDAGGTVRLATFSDPTGFTAVPASTYDPSASTLYLLESWDGSHQQLRLDAISGAVGSETYNAPSSPNVTLSLGTWDQQGSTNSGGFAPQVGSTNLIDTGDDRIHSVVYRGGTLWGAQTVFLPCCATTITPPTRSAVQWFQLAPSLSGTTLAASVTQSGRIDDAGGDPTTGHHRFFAYPSLAVSAAGDVGIGYGRFSADQYAGADYAFRAAADPPGTLRGDTVLHPGLAPYNKTFSLLPNALNRWGDYSTTVIDPVDDSTMWTIQEYAALPGVSDDLWGTWWGRLAGPGAHAAGTVADVDGDHRTDPTVFRPSTGTWYSRLSSGSPTYTATPWGQSGDIPVPADYLGQGYAQDAVFRPSTGTWFITRPGGTYTAIAWGQQGDVPVPADYDGTGSPQVAVYRPSTGAWYVRHADGTWTVTAWGAPGGGDIPVPADYDGAGRAQLAIYRPATGQWYVLHANASYSAPTWGQAGDVPVPADYDGAGRAQVAVYRPATGEWFVLHANGGYTDTVWGQSGDIPQPGDYNGDGRADPSVYRPGSTGVWYVLPSGGAGYTATPWGSGGDIPAALPAGVRQAFAFSY